MSRQRSDGPEPVARMSYPRLYGSADGETHFQDIPVHMSPVAYVPGFAEVVDVAAAQAATALTFSRLEAGFNQDWHPAPRRQFVLVLSGGIELTASDGEIRTFGPGGVYLVEDTTGKGHRTRSVGSAECLAVNVAC